jgi:hypothetical protein
MLCDFCYKLCSSTLATADSLDAQRVENKMIYDQPGQDANTLLSGSRQGCYICFAFWSGAPLVYRNGVENGSLSLPHYQSGVVNSYEIAYLSNPEMKKIVKIWVYYDPVKNTDVSAQSTGVRLRKIRGGKREYAIGFTILPYSGMYTSIKSQRSKAQPLSRHRSIRTDHS